MDFHAGHERPRAVPHALTGLERDDRVAAELVKQRRYLGQVLCIELWTEHVGKSEGASGSVSKRSLRLRRRSRLLHGKDRG